MTLLTRRSLLAGTSAAGAALTLGRLGAHAPAHAAAPPAGNQAPGWYRYKVGSIEITVVTDGVSRFKFADNHVTNKSRDEVNAALTEAHYEKDMMTTPYKLVVIDTGTSEANFGRSKGAAGQFHGNLKAAGIDRNAVDIVLISHFHGDHINGLLASDDKPAFPNAEILVPEAEWRYFMDDAEMAKQTSERMKT